MTTTSIPLDEATKARFRQSLQMDVPGAFIPEAWKAATDEQMRPDETHPAIAYIKTIFQPADNICIGLINRKLNTVEHLIQTAERAAVPDMMATLGAKRIEGYDIYVAMNPLQPGAKYRRKEFAGEARNVFIDIDVNGERNLEAVRQSVACGEIPSPSALLLSSPGKYQVVWMVTSGTLEQVEAINRSLMKRFGADPASVDFLRFLRLPGFSNWKYADEPVVRLIVIDGGRHTLADFRIPIEETKPVAVRLDAAEGEIAEIAERFESNAAECGLDISSLSKWGENGYLWTCTCPWVAEHTDSKDSGTVVILHRSGALDFKCQHAHCADRRWKELRAKMDEMAGMVLAYSDQASLGPPQLFAEEAAGVAEATESVMDDDAAMLSVEENEAEQEKEYPVIPLGIQPGPEWDDDIFYGLSGDIIRKASAFNEAHPAGMLLDFLVALGNIFGRGPYFRVGATRHYTNENLARVGDSSYSRKGGGRDAIDELLRAIDPPWFQHRVRSGFASSEAIIHSIRDSSVQRRLDKHANVFKELVVPGIDDKRLCVREGELASVFILARKPDSRAGVVIRDMWDGKPLRNIVKGSGDDGLNNSGVCEHPHGSISGDTTRSELIRKMPTGADENGFGNRFL